MAENVNDLKNWTHSNVVEAYVNKYGPDPNIFFGKIYRDLHAIQENVFIKESVKQKAEEFLTNWQVWTQHYKRHYKGEAEVQQLKVKEDIFTLRASTEATLTNAEGALKAGKLLKNHMEAAVLKSTQTLKRTHNDKTENPDPVGQEEEDDTDEFDDSASEFDNNASEVVSNKRVCYDQLEKCGRRSSRNNDGDAEEQADESALDLKLLLENYSKKKTTSPYDPSHSFILDLSPLSKIRDSISREEWAMLVSDKPPIMQKSYHHEIESLLVHLFGKFDKGRPANLLQARNLWYTLRSLPAPKYSDNFSYNKDEWKKIQCWVEQAVGHFLDAFESSRNPLQQGGCHEHEWFHGYVIPIFQKALALDSTCYVPWGEVSVLASQRRHNHNKDVCIVIEKVERVHMLCSYEQYELVCGLSCGGPHFHDLTKLSSDEFSLPRIMKDMLDDIRLKFHCASKDESRLYVLGLQTYMTEIRIYLMDRREVYRLHFVKTFTLPLAFPAYQNLRTALKWAWNVRGMVKGLIEEIEKDSDDDDDRVKTPLYEPLIMPTQNTPKKVPKKRVTKK